MVALPWAPFCGGIFCVRQPAADKLKLINPTPSCLCLLSLVTCPVCVLGSHRTAQDSSDLKFENRYFYAATSTSVRIRAEVDS